MPTQQFLHCRRRNGFDLLAHPERVLLRKVLHQQRNVFTSFAQRGNADGKNIQPVVEVASELSIRHHLFQITISCRHQSRVNALRSRAAHPLVSALLQCAQEFRLEFKGHVTDFVKKQGAAVCQLKPAHLLCVCTCERAALVSEEFTLKQRAGNGGAVEGDETALLTAAPIVNGALIDYLVPISKPEDVKCCTNKEL